VANEVSVISGMEAGATAHVEVKPNVDGGVEVVHAASTFFSI